MDVPLSKVGVIPHLEPSYESMSPIPTEGEGEVEGPGGGGKGGGRSGRGGGGGGGGDGDKVESRAEHAARREKAKAQAMDTADPQEDYADVVFVLWTQNARKRCHGANMKKADETRDEVQKWLNYPQNQV
jgi:hypothetical protein